MLISIGESDVDKVCMFVKDLVRISPPTELKPLSSLQDTVTMVTDGVSIYTEIWAGVDQKQTNSLK